MRLKPGERLGPYQIVSLVGSGGMGEVYRALDVRLGRHVAVKILANRGAKDAEVRFEREARAVAALSHLNVVALHDVGEADGLQYTVSELLEGQLLRERLRAGPITLSEALAIAIQIADGLTAAHGRGIVHRDLKPGNIFLTTDGVAKILDLGLARIEATAPGPSDTTTVYDEGPSTDHGIIVGTAAYMSPEQVRGDVVDARSDIFSFGSMLFEMLAGRSPFDRGSPAPSMMAVMNEPAPPLPESSERPLELDQIVAACLEKDRDQRIASARELGDRLRDLLRHLDPAASQSLVVPVSSAEHHPTAPLSHRKTKAHLSTRLRQWRWVGASVGVIVVVAGLWLILRAEPTLPTAGPPSPEAPTELIKPVQVTTSLGLDLFPALSPDGGSLAYCSDRSGSIEIWVRPLAPGGREVRLTEDEGDDLAPAWSPDGHQIAFESKQRGGIWIVPALGGRARQLVEFGSRPAWSPDGKWIVFQSGALIDIAANAIGELPPSAIWIIGADGQNRRALTAPHRPAGGHSAPNFSPDGKRVVFSSYTRQTSSLWTISAAGGEAIPLATGFEFTFDPVWLPTGDALLFGRSEDASTYSLWRMAITADGQPAGPPIEVLALGASAIRHPTVARKTGELAFSALELNSNLWSLPLRAGGGEASGPPRPLTRETSRNSRPAFSPDGSLLAFVRWQPGGHLDVWMMNRDGTDPQQLTFDPEQDSNPNWLADGRRLLYLSIREQGNRIMEVDRETGRASERFDPSRTVDAMRISHDGGRIAFHSPSATGALNVWVLDLATGQQTQVTEHQSVAAFPSWSPDGRRLAIQVREEESTQVGVLDLTSGSIQILTHDEGQAWVNDWSPDGRRILFAGQRSGLWDLWTVPAAGGTASRLTNLGRLGNYVRLPIWSPKGNEIVFELAESRGNIWKVDRSVAQ